MLTVRPVLVCGGTDEVTEPVRPSLVVWVIASVVPDGVEEVEVPVRLTLVLCDGTDEVTVVVWLTLVLVPPALLTYVDPSDPVVVPWPTLLVCGGRDVTMTEVV